MTSRTHEEILIAGIKALRDQGFRIIRLDKRIIPDAIAIKENVVVAVEASTNPTAVWLSRRKLEKSSQYDTEIIVTKPYSHQYHKEKTYRRVLELYQSGGLSYRNIRKQVMTEFQLEHLSISTIYDWIKGNKKPLTLLENV